jgi:hypothetical protein
MFRMPPTIPAAAFFIMSLFLLGAPVHAQPTVAVTPATQLTRCDVTSLATPVDISGAVAVRGFEVRVAIDESKLALSNTSPYGFTEGTFLSGVGATTFLVAKLAEGSYQVAGTILGATGGASGSGTLFTITGDPIGECGTTVTLSALKVRDVNNVDLGGIAASGTINVDCTDPCVTSVTATGTCWTMAPALTVSGSEGTCAGSDVVLLEYQYQPNTDPCNPGGTWLSLASGSFGDGPSWGPTGLHTPGATPASPGNYTVYVRATDAAGNVTDLCSCVSGYNFNYNPTAPVVQVTNLAAVPGHNKVSLTWTNPTLTGAEEVVLMRKRETVYPIYGSNTAYPTSVTDLSATLVYSGTGTSFVDLVGTSLPGDRDIYLYRAFVQSCGGELAGAGRTTLEQDFAGEIMTDATDAATNYHLGDLDDVIPSGFGGPYDGFVTATDLTVFSSVYGLAPGNAEADFAPTVMPPNQANGIPNPDGLTDFEDLILFAINYGVVAPFAGGEPEDVSSARPAGSVELRLDPTVALTAGARTYTTALVVKGDAQALQALRTRVTFDPTAFALESAKVTPLVAGAQQPHFFKALPKAGAIELSLAMLGRGATLPDGGAVVALKFRRVGTGEPAFELSESTARGISNQELLRGASDPAATTARAGEDAESSAKTAVGSLPARNRLADPEPNPFNPSTMLAFDLAAAGRVELAIVDVAGRRVRTLADGDFGAGSYTLTWDGRDDRGQASASGIYFAHLRAGDFRAERRLVLLK